MVVFDQEVRCTDVVMALPLPANPFSMIVELLGCHLGSSRVSCMSRKSPMGSKGLFAISAPKLRIPRLTVDLSHTPQPTTFSITPQP